MDARSGEETSQIKDAHEGAKSVKLCYLGAKDKLVSFGFTKQSQRQLKVIVVWQSRRRGFGGRLVFSFLFLRAHAALSLFQLSLSSLCLSLISFSFQLFLSSLSRLISLTLSSLSRLSLALISFAFLSLALSHLFLSTIPH